MTLNEMAAFVFERRFGVHISNSDKVIIMPKPEIAPYVTPWESNGMDMNGVRYEHTHSADYILARYAGLPMDIDDEWSQEQTAKEKFVAYLTINDMVELWAATRRLHFVKAQDIVTVHNHLTAYLAAIEEAVIFRPNYRRPPDEDIEKMTRLMNDMRGRAEGLQFENPGNDAWSQLAALFSMVSTVEATEKKEVVSSNLSLEDNDPFKFLHRGR